MGMTSFTSARRTIGWLVFAAAMMWPLFHMVIVHSSTMSSWRFFGWGMYATPNPEAATRLRLVILQDGVAQDVLGLYSDVNRISSLNTESTCVNLFQQEASAHVRKISHDHICRDKMASQHLDRFLHLGKTDDLRQFAQATLRRVGAHGNALAFVTHQRIDLFAMQAYLASDVYRISDDRIDQLVSINGGGHRENTP
jgi:hypothetical protein